MGRKVTFSLFAKFSIGIAITIAIFGLINIIIVNNSVSKSLTTEFNKRGYFISRTLAEQSLGYILSDNTAGLNLLVNEIKAIDNSVHYVFILDDHNEVLAHSFNQRVPNTLITANKLQPIDTLKTIMIEDVAEPHLIIKDFAMPILTHNIGTVRVGILENEIHNQLSITLSQLWIMIGVFLFFGLMGALFFFYTIAVPLKVLSKQSEDIDIKTIRTGLSQIIDLTKMKFFRIRKIYGTTDEIDLLYSSYATMLERLEMTHEKLNHLQQSLMHSEKMASIGTLTAGVAHEINNPMAGMRICLERMSKKPEDIEQTKKYILLMQEATERVENVVKDLLTFSRKSYPEYEEVNACDIIQKSITLAQYRSKKHNISIEFDNTLCPFKIHVSSNSIEQVFLNIIINAVDSILKKIEVNPEHKGVVRVIIEDHETNSHILITDNGSGIEESIMGKIFDPFFTTKKVGEGTGLGLPISYQIVKDHGGDIQVESKDKNGATFRIIIPKR
jgi:two-component system, NtrC family, sensor kinase